MAPTPDDPTRPGPVRPWRDVGAAIALVVGGAVLDVLVGRVPDAAELTALAVTGVAVALRRRSPAGALALATLAAAVQVGTGLAVSPAQVGMLLVVHDVGVRGERALAWTTALLLPVAAAVATVALVIEDSHLIRLPNALAVGQWGRMALVYATPLTPLVLAWLTGLLRRSTARARQEAWRAALASADSARADQVAALQRRRAELGREVHDVVGHSLAVIIALADSVRFRDAGDPKAFDQVQAAVATIASTARVSLEEVREVLNRLADPADPAAPAAPGDPADAVPPAALDEMLDRVRQAGVVLDVRYEGEPGDLPSEARGALLAVVREMLTNALRHGDRSRPVEVVQRWTGDGLLFRVRNGAAAGAGREEQARQDGQEGRGIPGMRARLERVGGRLAASRQPAGTGSEFVVSAWVPAGAAGAAERAEERP